MSSEEVPTTGHRVRRRIRHRTAQLPVASRILYRIEHYSSMAGVAIAVPVLLACFIVAGACLGFRRGWVVGFELSASSTTLVMVFVIQHTQGREQAATQRKLDELLRAIPGAAESLMMLEEAPQEFMLKVEERQRDTRSDSVGDNPAARPGWASDDRRPNPDQWAEPAPADGP